MASKMKSSFANMVIVLGLVSAIAAVSLGFVFELTKEPISKAQAEKLKKAIAMVAPEFEDLKEFNVAPADNVGDSLTFYEVSKEGKVVGTAVRTWTDKGFGGRIWAIVCFLPDGTINNSNVLLHKETPGLGDKTDISKSTWNEQFQQKNPASFRLTVKKDGGDVNAITAATISSRAYCDALTRAYKAFMKQKKSGGDTQEEADKEAEKKELSNSPNDTVQLKEKGGNE